MTPNELSALRAIIDTGKDFCAIVLPREEHLRFLKDEEVTISSWIGATGPMQIPNITTAEEEYISNVTTLIGELKISGGKTVISRNICGKFCNFDPTAMAAQYFELFPDTLRFIFSRANCGIWMGATPELLLQLDGSTIHTRALAGTRRYGDWTSKEFSEHKYVVDDITAHLTNINLNPFIGKTTEISYGAIKHLCTPISAEINNAAYEDITDILHPTPAVGGYPRTMALAQIAKFEKHPRNYYGGLLDITTKGHRLTYVILRTVQMDHKQWCIYSGGGITGDSNAQEEFKETEYKAQALLNILEPYSAKDAV